MFPPSFIAIEGDEYAIWFSTTGGPRQGAAFVNQNLLGTGWSTWQQWHQRPALD